VRTNLTTRNWPITLATYAAIFSVPIIAIALLLSVGLHLGGAEREALWNIGDWVRIPIWVAAAVILLIFVNGPFRRYRLWRLGRGESRAGNWFQRAKAFLLYGIGQGRLPGDTYASVMHLLIFWGFAGLFIGTLIVAFNDDFYKFISGTIYLGLSLTLDLCGLLATVGVLMALFRRYFMRPAKLRLASLWDDVVLLWLILAILVTGFLVEAMRLGATELPQHPDWAGWSPVGWIIARPLTALGVEPATFKDMHRVFWWAHLPLAFGFIAWVGYGKISHILLGSANIFMRNISPTGAAIAGSTLAPIADIETAEVFGAGRLQDFTWKQIMDVDVCVRCGRCEANCPANLTGKELSPMGFLRDMHAYVDKTAPLMLRARRNGSKDPLEGERLIAGDVVSDNVIWDCLTCGACETQCPLFIEHIPKLVGMRRYLVMDQARMPETAQATLMQLEQRGHPWRGTPLARTSWIEEMGNVPMFDGSQEYLFWVGCSGALSERNVLTTKAIARLLNQAGVSYGVLGAEETCCGDPARRLGNEYLFMLQAQQNIELFKAKGVKKILTSCPHGFNTLKNEYPQFDGHFEVIHHADFFAQLVREGRLKPREALAQKITYHDSCYLGRHNNLYEAPRHIVASLPGAEAVEMARTRVESFCCGGGGGHMWVEENPGKRVNQDRAIEAEATGAQIVATACPLCLQMFEDGIAAVPAAAEREMKVYDVAELLDMAVAPAPAVAKAAKADPSQSQAAEPPQ